MNASCDRISQKSLRICYEPMQKKRLLIIGLVWPEPSSTAAGNRMLQLVHFFLEQEYDITFASTASKTTLSMDLEELGVQTAFIRLNHDSFDDFIRELNPEIVLFDRFLTEEQFGWRTAQFAPNALRILDTEDLHSLRHTRHEALKADKPFSTDLWLQNDMTKREMASIYRCDLSLIISFYEMQLLTDSIKMDKDILVHLPFLLDKIDVSISKSWKAFEQRKDIICIGNGKHAPNIDAIVWLKKKIWPSLRKRLPKAELHIYGAYFPEHIKQMHNEKEGFLIKGWTSDLQNVFQNTRLNLAPLRFGAGIKGKLIDAMQSGTPSVTTSIGAEGMHANLDWSGRITYGVKDFVEATVTMYNDDTQWKQAQQNGIYIINELYDKEALGKQLSSKIENVQQNLEQHRTRNFIGSMLMHHTAASTKYMSKWIASKNAADCINKPDAKRPNQ